MVSSQVAVAKDLEVDKRVVLQLSRAAIKSNPILALVELITNSDDSYRRINTVSGAIQIEVERKKQNTKLKVTDNAEGLDAKRMDEVVGVFGSDTSGLTEGKDVRGYFGRGLKEAIFGLGRGRIISIKNGYLYECELDDKGNYRRQKPLRATKQIRSELGISENGTIVEIVVTRKEVRIPNFDNLLTQLERYYSLREINSTNKRSVFLIDKKNKRRSKLEYKFPIGIEVVNKERIGVESFPNASFDIQIFKANENLTQDGYCREGGLLIKSNSGIHDVTLLKFENDVYAERIFGNVKCKYLDELIKREEPVISDRRDSLDWKHEFCLKLKETIEKELAIVVEEIKREDEKKKKAIENEKTRQRFRSAVEKINEIAFKELGSEEGEGVEGGKEKRKRITDPPNGFDFVPEYYHIEVGKKSTLSLKATVPGILSEGDIIYIESDNADVIIEEKIFKVNENEAINGVIVCNPKIVGKRVGVEAIITATSKDYRTEAYVKVVAKLEEHKSKPHKVNVDKGIINGIHFDPHLYESAKVRYRFVKEIGVIEIATTHPCVEIYLGPNGERQDEATAQVLIAELVTVAVCWEIARRKYESNMLAILSSTAQSDAIKRENDRLIDKYAHSIHQLIVGLKGKGLKLVQS